MKIAILALCIIGKTLGFGYSSAAAPLNLESLNLNLGNNWQTLSAAQMNASANAEGADAYLTAEGDNYDSQGVSVSNGEAALEGNMYMNMAGNNNMQANADLLAQAQMSGDVSADSNANAYMTADSNANAYMTADSNADMNLEGQAQLAGQMSLEGQAELAGQMSLEGQAQLEGQTVTAGRTMYLRGPTVVRQQLVQQPIIRQRIVQQPIIRRRVVKKQLNRSQSTLPLTQTQNTQTRSQDIRVPGQEIMNNETVQPTLHTRNTQVNLNRGGERVVNREPIINATQTRNENRVRVQNAPAQQIYHHTRVQPTLHTINEKVNLVQLPDRVVNYDQVVRATQNRTVNRTQAFNVPANEIHSHTQIRPQLLNVNTQLNLERSPDVVVNRPDQVLASQNSVRVRTQNETVPAQKTFVQPVIQYVINENETHHIHKPVFKRVPYLKKVTVPTTILQKNPVVKRVPVPVKTQSQASVRSREYAFNVNPSGRASTGWVQRRSFNLPAQGVPVEVNGGKAVWGAEGQPQPQMLNAQATWSGDAQAYRAGPMGAAYDAANANAQLTQPQNVQDALDALNAEDAQEAQEAQVAQANGQNLLNANVFQNNLQGGNWTYVGKA